MRHSGFSLPSMYTEAARQKGAGPLLGAVANEPV